MELVLGFDEGFLREWLEKEDDSCMPEYIDPDGASESEGRMRETAGASWRRWANLSTKAFPPQASGGVRESDESLFRDAVGVADIDGAFDESSCTIELSSEVFKCQLY